jgi:hypothetical protein
MGEKKFTAQTYRFKEVQCLINHNTLVLIVVISAALGAGAWAWWNDPFVMSLLIVLAVMLVFSVAVMAIARLSIQADKTGVQLRWGLFTKNPRSIGWDEISSVAFMDIHPNGSLANIDRYLNSKSIAYVCQGHKAVVIERLNNAPVVFSVKNAEGFQKVLEGCYVPRRSPSTSLQ